MLSKKGGPSSAAGARGTDRQGAAARLEPDDGVVDLGEGFGGDAVVHPAALAAILDELGVAQHTQVERQAGLCRIERVLQVADATLAIAQHVEDRQTRGIRQGVEEPRGACETGGGGSGGGHALKMHQFFLIRKVGRLARFPRMRRALPVLAPLAGAAPVLTIIAAVVARRLGDGAGGTAVSSLHLAVAIALYTVAGLRSARAGGLAWVGGFLVALVDAAIGHGGAFLLAPPPSDPAAYAPALGRTPPPEEVPMLQAQAAAAAALGAMVFGTIAGAIGGVIARRRPAVNA